VQIISDPPSDQQLPIQIYRRGKLAWASQLGPQTGLFGCKADIIQYGGARGGGKLSPDDSLVCTPKGFRRLGELKVGQQVTDPVTGGASSVIAIYPHPEMDIWEFVFDDGASLEVGADHLWAFRLSNHHRPRTKESTQRNFSVRVLGSTQPKTRWHNYQIGTTQEIIDLFRKRKRLRFPLTEPVSFTNNWIPRTRVSAYLVGLFLGDGYLPQLKITSVDSQISEYLKGLGFNNSQGDDDWRAVGKIRKSLYTQFTDYGILHCRSWEKFVPEPLKNASVQERLELLRGLLDTDGTVDKRGRVSFSSVSIRLAQDVQWLARSLGGKARLSRRQTYYEYKGKRKKGRPSFKISIWMPKTSCLFKLIRKKKRCTDSWNGGHEISRKLSSIRYVGKKKARCIRVSSPFGMYVGNDFVVTHNSDAAILWAAGFHTFGGTPYFDVPRYRAVIFRRSFPELKRTLIERSFNMLNDWWKYTERDHIWERKLPGGGKAILEFAHLESPSDVFKYTGAEYSRIVFDESNMHAEQEVRFMISCLRTAAQGVKPQMLLLPNPVGPGFGWHKLLFIKNKEPYTLYTDAVWPSDRKPLGLSTYFIPAKVWDNRELLKNDPGYVDRLRSQYGKLAEAMIEGSWEEGEHIAFNEFSEDTHCISAFNEGGQFVIPSWADTWLTTDWGGTGPKAKDFASTVMLAADNKKVYAVWDHTRKGKDIVPYAYEILERVRLSDKLQKPTFMVLSHDCFSEHGVGKTQADQFADVMQKGGITVVKGDRDPQGRLILMREFLRITPVRSAGLGHDAQDFEYWNEEFRKRGAQAGEEYMRAAGILRDGETLPKLLFLLPTPDGRYGCPDLIKNLLILAVDMKNPLQLAEGQDDDSCDALGSGLKFFIAGPQRPREEIYKELIGSNLPDSTVAITLATEEAERRYNKESDVPTGPIRWPMKSFE